MFIRIARNNRLTAFLEAQLLQAKTEFEATGEKVRRFTWLSYKAQSWDKERFVIGNAEHTSQGSTLWTNLDNWKLYPALEVLSLYGKRWEEELYYKELKIDLHKRELLQSQTVVTCLQEIAALILASAILSQGRLSLGKNQNVSSLRISFIQVREHLNVMWLAIQAAKKLLTHEQLQIMIDDMITLAQRESLIPPRRSRSCSRAL